MGQGINQLLHEKFRTVFIPPWPSEISGLAVWVYFFSAALIGVGVAIILDKKARVVALFLGGAFLVLVVFWHFPYMLFIFPHKLKHLGVWTDVAKELAFSGGAFAVAGSFPKENASTGGKSFLVRLLEKLIPLGRYLFSAMIVTFGIDHFLYTENVATLVPAWIPGHIFWTYFAGVALIGSGTAIILKFSLKVVAILQGTMIFLWFVLLHIPSAITNPLGGEGIAVASAFDALGFSGIAFVLANVARITKSE